MIGLAKLGTLKLSGPLLIKLGVPTLGILAVIEAAPALPLSNGWFDAFWAYQGISLLGAFVSGEPEPDVLHKVKHGEMTWAEFYYTWFFRSSHLYISAATAYSIHPNKWKDISGKTENAE